MEQLEKTEEDVRNILSSFELEVIIKSYIRTGETNWLDFKSVPSNWNSKDTNKFRADLPKIIQGFTNAKGGLLILGVNQEQPDDPVEDILAFDNWLNHLFQIRSNLVIPFIPLTYQIRGKTVIILIIAQSTHPVYVNGLIRVRSGTVEVKIENYSEQQNLEQRLLSENKGFDILEKIKQEAGNSAIRLIRDGEGTSLTYYYTQSSIYKKLSQQLETNQTTLTLALYAIANNLERPKPAKQSSNVKLNFNIASILLKFILIISTVIFLFLSVLTWLFYSGFPEFTPIFLIGIFIIILIPFTRIDKAIDRNFSNKRDNQPDLLQRLLERSHPGYFSLSGLKKVILINKNINEAINWIIYPMLIYYFFKLYRFDSIDSPQNEWTKLIPSLQNNLIDNLDEFENWIQNQNYVNDIRTLPDENTIGIIKYLALSVHMQSSTDQEKWSINDEFKGKEKQLITSIHYILLHYLYLLE